MHTGSELNTKKQQVAVFDFDGTSITGQSGELFTRYLIRRGMMSIKAGMRLLWWGVRYTLHAPIRQDEARELVFSALEGHSPEEIDAIMADFHDEVLAPLYRPSALEEVARCKREGQVTLLVSATFEAIAAVAARSMGTDGYVATKMARDASGNYTGAVEGPVVAGDAKYLAAAAWCDEHLGPGRWELVRAYGDHHTDEDLLAHAQTPCAVCPGKTLRLVAKRRGWQVLNWGS